LISRPTQISMRVGVVQAMAFGPYNYIEGHRLNPVARQRKHPHAHLVADQSCPPSKGFASWAQRPSQESVRRSEPRCLPAQKENRTLAGPVCSSPARGRQSPSRGEQLTACRLRSGRMGNRRAASDKQYAAPNSSDNTKGRMPAMRPPQIRRERVSCAFGSPRSCPFTCEVYATAVDVDGTASSRPRSVFE
jgi:hypothetical protein